MYYIICSALAPRSFVYAGCRMRQLCVRFWRICYQVRYSCIFKLNVILRIGLQLFLMYCMQWVLIERVAVPRLCDWAAVRVRHALPGRERSAPGAQFPLAAQHRFVVCTSTSIICYCSSIVAVARYACRWPHVRCPGRAGATSSRRSSASWESSSLPSCPVRPPRSRARCRHGRLRSTRNLRCMPCIRTYNFHSWRILRSTNSILIKSENKKGIKNDPMMWF